MELRWTAPAADELEAALNFYYERNAEAARQIAERIAYAAKRLIEQPSLGRAGAHPDHPEWVIDFTPYVIVYRISDKAVEILHVWHGAQNWREN